MTGGFVSYYLAKVAHPQRTEQPPYQAECEDIIQALEMTFDEGCIFKAIWRSAAARLGDRKPGHNPTYDAEKIVHYGKRNLLRVNNQNVALTHSTEGIVPTKNDKPKPDQNGWISWSGGNDPFIAKGTLVDIRLRSGNVVQAVSSRNVHWLHNRSAGDVTYYRQAR